MIFFPTESLILGFLFLAVIFYYFHFQALAWVWAETSLLLRDKINKKAYTLRWIARLFLVLFIACGVTSSFVPIY